MSGWESWCSGILAAEYSCKMVDKNIATLQRKYEKKVFKRGKIQISVVKKMLVDVDKMWYQGRLLKGMRKVYSSFILSTHDSSGSNAGVAGFVVVHEDDSIELSFNEPLFAGIFGKKEKGYHAGGLLCTSRFDCFMHIMLHESVHLALSLCETLDYWDDADPHSPKFQFICKNFFNQTDHNHGIMIGFNQTMPLNKIKATVKPGQKVRVFTIRPDGTTQFVDGSIVSVHPSGALVKMNNVKKMMHYGLICATNDC